MTTKSEDSNKALVLEAFDTLFNKRDYAAAERFWSSNYIQHSAHIEPGREGLFNLIKSAPASLKYEPGVIVAQGDFVIVHGLDDTQGSVPTSSQLPPAASEKVLGAATAPAPALPVGYSGWRLQGAGAGLLHRPVPAFPPGFRIEARSKG